MYGTALRIFWIGYISICLSACTENELLLDGIGSSVYVSDTRSRVELPVRYFGAMCLRAGAPYQYDKNGMPICLDKKIRSKKHWKQVIFAAINDINERCDLYLNSIDNAKRNRAFYRSQLENISNTTNTVLAETRSGAKALAIVEAAFGLTKNTFENYYSRLILETDKSSVQSLVSKLQSAYRFKMWEELDNSVVESIGLSAAHYVVKGYVRLCLPSSIEAEINSMVDGVVYRGTTRYTENGTQNPLLNVLNAIPSLDTPTETTRPGGGNPSKNEQGGRGSPGRQDVFIKGAHTASPVEPNITLTDGKKIQKILCVEPQDGDFGGDDTSQPTRQAVQQFYLALKRDASHFLRTDDDKSLILRKSTSCFNTDYKNSFERFKFPEGTDIKSMHVRLSFWLSDQHELNPALKIPEKLRNQTFRDRTDINEDTREAIRLIQNILGVSQTGVLTHSLWQKTGSN